MYSHPSARASAAYRQVDLNSQVMSASPHQLIGLLFTELRTCLLVAKDAIVRKDVTAKVRFISKAARLLDEGLISGLDMQAGGALAENLQKLYSYCLVRLTQANAQNDATAIDEVLNVLQPVMDGWSEIGNQART